MPFPKIGGTIMDGFVLQCEEIDSVGNFDLNTTNDSIAPFSRVMFLQIIGQFRGPCYTVRHA